MKLFEIRIELEKLLDSIDDRIASCVDPETGEVIKDIETEYAQIQDEISALEITRDEKRDGVACAVLGIRAEAEAIRAQEQTLFRRRKALENKADRLSDYLEKDLNGEPFASPRVKVTFRPTISTEIEPAFIDWARENGLHSLLRYKDPEPDKKAVKKLLESGQTIPGAHLEKHLKMSIK